MAKIFETPKLGQLRRQNSEAWDQILLGYHQTYRQDDLSPLDRRLNRGTAVKTMDSHKTIQLRPLISNAVWYYLGSYYTFIIVIDQRAALVQQTVVK